jgi:hypothetical protein
MRKHNCTVNYIFGNNIKRHMTVYIATSERVGWSDCHLYCFSENFSILYKMCNDKKHLINVLHYKVCKKYPTAILTNFTYLIWMKIKTLIYTSSDRYDHHQLSSMSEIISTRI